MPRISVPVDREFMSRFNSHVDWSIRGKLVRKLIEIAMNGSKDRMYELVYSDKKYCIEEDKSEAQAGTVRL